MADLRYNFEIGGITRTITDLNGLAKALKENTDALKKATIGSKEYEQALIQNNGLKVFQKEILATSQAIIRANQSVTQSLNGSQTASANASMALLNLNYVVRDSPYFFQNFALGVLAVGNNLNPLIDSFNRLRKEALEKNITTVGLLKQALVGGAGLSIAFSLVVTAIQAFVFWQARSSRESEEHKTKLKEEREEVSRLRNEYNALVKDRELRKKDDTSLTKLDQLRQQRGVVSKSVEYFKDELRPLKPGSINYEEGVRNLAAERYQLEKIDNEINFILFAWQKVVDENEKDNKKLKEKKLILDDLSAKEAKLINIRQGSQNFQGQGIFKRQDVRNFRGDSPDGLSRASDRTTKSGAFGFGGVAKEVGIDLEMGKIAAQELGNAISSAFEQGTISLNKFINSLIAAIAKMLILRAVTSFLTGGGSAIANVATPSIPGVGNPSLGKSVSNSVVNVQGKISVNKNKFVVDIENARDSYNNNAKLVTIGRD